MSDCKLLDKIGKLAADGFTVKFSEYKNDSPMSDSRLIVTMSKMVDDTLVSTCGYSIYKEQVFESSCDDESFVTRILERQKEEIEEEVSGKEEDNE